MEISFLLSKSAKLVAAETEYCTQKMRLHNVSNSNSLDVIQDKMQLQSAVVRLQVVDLEARWISCNQQEKQCR